MRCPAGTRYTAFLLALAGLCAGCAGGPPPASAGKRLDPASFQLVREVDERFQSFQIGMSHLTGGETWRTYDGDGKEGEAGQAESFEEVREARAPTDLANRRLRNLASALGPLYIRYGGTTSNSVFFHDSDSPAPDNPPEGFQTVLTRERWKAAIDFAEAADARIITGFTVSDGVRDASGAWTPAHAAPWLAYTRSVGGEIYAAELYNEPNAREPGRTEEPESAENYARDFAALAAFRDIAAPELKLAGPGTAMLGLPVPIPALESVTAEQYMSAEPRPVFDIVSYHFYGALAERCAPPDSPAGVSAEDALTEEWLARPDNEFLKFRALRDEYAPGAPIWLTETGTAACGGTRWQPTFLDSFHFVDRQARLAKQGLDVIVTHALVSGSNGVIDETTFMPNADYWAALLWRRLMGSKVLDAGPIEPGLHVYAHCQRGVPGGVTVLAINLREEAASLSLQGPADIYALTAPELQSRTVSLNGRPLALGGEDELPELAPAREASGDVILAPASVSFIAVPEARNAACE
jgi:heparanase